MRFFSKKSGITEQERLQIIIDAMIDLLNRAVESQEYEFAAIIRDEIKRLKTPIQDL